MRVLYHSLFCPFSRKIRLGLLEKKVESALQEEKWGELRQDLLSINPTGTLPLLWESKNNCIMGAYAVAEFLEEIFPQTNLMGKGPSERAEIRRLVHWFEQRFYNDVHMNLFFEKITKRFFGKGGPDSIKLRIGRECLRDHLLYIGWLSDSRRWLGGSAFSWADITAASFLSCIDYLGDIPWHQHENVKEWYMRIKSRPSFRPFLSETLKGFLPAPNYGVLDF